MLFAHASLVYDACSTLSVTSICSVLLPHLQGGIEYKPAPKIGLVMIGRDEFHPRYKAHWVLAFSIEVSFAILPNINLISLCASLLNVTFFSCNKTFFVSTGLYV